MFDSSWEGRVLGRIDESAAPQAAMVVLHHHFIGAGRTSHRLIEAAREPEVLAAGVTGLVAQAGLHVVTHTAARFDNGGLTLAWILAESHLVLHHWEEEGFATLDLHICDYRGSNVGRAERLVEALAEFCFVAGSETWQESHLHDPVAASAPGSPLTVG